MTLYTFSFLLTTAFGQKTDFRIVLHSGLFSFSGQSAEKTSSINYTEDVKEGATNNPYGTTGGLCYSVSGNLKRITKNHFIAGLDLGYEVLRSKISIDMVNNYLDTSTVGYAVSGQTFLIYNFINCNPFIGYRFPIKKISFDLIGGFDIAYCVTAREQGDATALNGTKYQTSVYRKTIKTDIRPRLQISADYKKIGLFAGYSMGLINYKSGYIGGTNECYSRLLRFGVTYLLL